METGYCSNGVKRSFLVSKFIKQILLNLCKLCFVCFIAFLTACSSSQPKNINNICDIFLEKRSWYKRAKKAEDKWNVNISTNMAFIHQESSFRAKAKPPRKKILGFIPGPRKSSSYGYSQAKKTTWAWYKKTAKRGGADRDNFGDSIDLSLIHI